MPDHCAGIASKVAVGNRVVPSKSHLAQNSILLCVTVLEQQVAILGQQARTLMDDRLQVGITTVLRDEG